MGGRCRPVIGWARSKWLDPVSCAPIGCPSALKKRKNTDENNHLRSRCSHHCRRAFGPRSRRIEPGARSNCVREARNVSCRPERFGYDREDGFALAKTERLAVGLVKIVPRREKQRESHAIKRNFDGGHAGEEIDSGSDAERH